MAMRRVRAVIGLAKPGRPRRWSLPLPLFFNDQFAQQRKAPMTTQETDQRARRAFVLLNHTLTQAQRDDLAAQWGVTDIILPDAVLSQAWSRVDPRGDLDTQLLDAVETWLVAAARPDDLVVAQGEFGATYAVVGRALRLGLVPVYATSVRNAVETLMPDGAVRIQRVFAHVQFRRYPV